MFLWRATRVAVEHSGRSAHAGESDQSGVGVRVAVGRRLAASTSSGLSEGDVAWTVEQALASARVTPEHPIFRELPAARPVTAPPTPVNPRVAPADVDRLLADVTAAADGVRRVPAVTYFNATAQTVASEFVVANSRGVAAWDRNAYESMMVETRAAGFAAEKLAVEALADRVPLSEGRDLANLAESAARRAQEARAPKPLPGFVHDVVFDATTAMQLVNHFADTFSGAAARKGKSRLAGELDQPVAAPSITIVESPHGPRGCRNQRVDDEGVPTESVALVEKGVLKSFLWDSLSAHAEGRASNGHGLRPLDVRYAGGVSVRPTNLDVRRGDQSLDEMIASADRAVLVRDFLMGTFTMNHLTGDFSFVAPHAYYVEKGRIEHALVSTTVAGNLFDAMRNVIAVGKDARPYRGGRCVPLRVTGLTCAT